MAMVDTIYGPMDTAALKCVEGTLDNDNEHTEWIEYWLAGELVHRSVNMVLKHNPLALGVAAMLE